LFYVGEGMVLSYRRFIPGLVALVLVLAAVGCQQGPAVSPSRLLQRQAILDFSGLKERRNFEDLKVTVSTPQKWEMLPTQKTPLYLHQQWRSPSRRTGVGVAYVRMPIPLAAKALVWLAKQEYTKKSNDGKLIAQWTDAAGREWIEAENNKYHVRGYAVVHGFDAWFVYCGYKTSKGPDPAELNLAVRCSETILPIPLTGRAGETAAASAK
jgi:hypothetical protein